MDMLQRRLLGTAVVILGALIIFGVAFSAVLSGSTVSSSQTSMSENAAVGPNVTSSVGQVQMGQGSLSLTWVASGPITVYVLNQSQYGAFLQSTTAHTGQYPPYYTSQPTTYSYTATSATGATASLPAGTYYLLASAPKNATMVDLSESYPFPGSSAPVNYLGYVYIGGFGAMGVVLVVLGATFWRRPKPEPARPAPAS